LERLGRRNQVQKLGVDLAVCANNFKWQSQVQVQVQATAIRNVGDRRCMEIGGAWIDFSRFVVARGGEVGSHTRPCRALHPTDGLSTRLEFRHNLTGVIKTPSATFIEPRAIERYPPEICFTWRSSACKHRRWQEPRSAAWPASSGQSCFRDDEHESR
jgi:hypothetical protein